MPFLRPKTRRRLTILLLAALFLCGGGWVAMRVGQHRALAALGVLRAKGMTDYSAGNPSAALGELGDYLARGKQQDTDAEALFTYAMCRADVELPARRNIIEAIGILEHYRLLRPADLSASHALLKWYGKVHYHSEAMALADTLLATNPNDLDAMQAKIEALWGLSRLSEALAQSTRLNAEAPALLKGQLTTIYLLLALDRAAEAVRRAEELCNANPGDAHFEMLRGVAYMLAGRSADARVSLMAAAARDTDDADFAMEECRFLDAAGLYEHARGLLTRTARQTTAPAIVNSLLLRTYQDLGPVALLNTMSTLANAAIDSSRARGLKATALHETEQNPSSPVPIVGEDPVAKGWSIALAARFNKVDDPAAAAAAYRQALKYDPANVIAADWLADAEAQMGEKELALAMWRSTALACPNWGLPCIELATTLQSLGRPAGALEAAKTAVARAPSSFDAQFTLAAAMVATMPANASGATDDPTLSTLQRIRQNWPDRAELLPVYAAALARCGQTQAAAQIVEQTMVSTSSPQILFALSSVDQMVPLPADTKLEEKLQSALRLSAEANARDPITLKIAYAALRDATGDPMALANWIKLGDANPADVRVQAAVLRSPSRLGDRAFWKRTIDRVGTLVGEQGLTWRVEQARWILADQSPSADQNKELAEAVTRLQEVCRVAPDWAEARHLLGLAMVRTGKIPDALDELTAAADMAPADQQIVADLARLLRQTGRNDEAIAVIRRLADCPDLTPQARQWAEKAVLSDQLHSAIAEGDLREVEADCRRILALGSSPDASNDLAYALLLERRPNDRAEALRLAQTAVSQSPNQPEYRDTLRRIESESMDTGKIGVGQ